MARKLAVTVPGAGGRSGAAHAAHCVRYMGQLYVLLVPRAHDIALSIGQDELVCYDTLGDGICKQNVVV